LNNLDSETLLLLKKSGTKRNYKKLLAKQRVTVGFNTGSRLHKSKRQYSRKVKHKNHDFE
jgi:hypothetical protein